MRYTNRRILYFTTLLHGGLGRVQLTELKDRCTRLENQCKAKHAAGERSKALNNFNDKYNSVRSSQCLKLFLANLAVVTHGPSN